MQATCAQQVRQIFSALLIFADMFTSGLLRKVDINVHYNMVSQRLSMYALQFEA